MKVGGFLSKYLKAQDLPQPKLVTIERIDEEEVGGEAKLVVYFTECEPGIVLGRTTIEQIVEALGDDDTDNWIGWQIVIFNDPTVQYQGRRTGGIRFRKSKARNERKAVTPKTNSGVFGGGAKTADEQDDLPF